MAPNNQNSNKVEGLSFASLPQQQSIGVIGQQMSGSIVDHLFRDWLPKILEEKRHLVDVIKSVYQWNLTRDSKIVSVWTLDLKNGNGSIYEGPAKGKPDCTITLDEKVSLNVFNGSLDPAKAFITQQMKISGNLMAAHKFQQFWAEEAMSGALKTISDKLSQTGPSDNNTSTSNMNPKDDETLLQNIPTDGLKSDIVFNVIKTRMSEEPELVRAMKFIIQFNITRNGKVVAVWTANTKVEGGEVYRAQPKVKPDAIVNVDDENYVKLLFGKLNPQRAFMTGKIGVKGNILLLQKLDSFWNQVQGQRNDPEMPIVKDIMLKDPLKPGLKSEVIIFDLIQKLVRLPKLMAEGTNVYLQITKEGKPVSRWRIIFPAGQTIGTLERADNDQSGSSDISLTIDDNDFVRLAYNTLKLENAISLGRVKYSGDNESITKLSKLFQTPTIRAKL